MQPTMIIRPMRSFHAATFACAVAAAAAALPAGPALAQATPPAGAAANAAAANAAAAKAADVQVQTASDAGTITAVTLYPGRAAVTRTVTRALTQGVWTVRVPNLPSAVQPGSLQAKVTGEGGASAPKLLGVEYAQAEGTAFAGSPEGIALAQQIEKLQLDLAHLAQDRTLLDSQDKLVDAVGVRATAAPTPDGATQPLDMDRVAKQLEWVRTEKARILGVAREMNDRKEQLERELSAAKQQLAARGGESRTERAALVNVAVPAGTNARIELTYLVDQAGWQPAYSIRAAGDRSGTTIEYDALIVQRTGEDWKDVKLSLSTAQPTRASSPPAVEPWFVDVYVPPVEAAPMAVTGRADAMADAAPGSPMPPGAPPASGDPGNPAVRKQLEAMSAGAAIQDNGVAVSFDLPRAVTVPNDADKRQRTRIASLAPATAFGYVAAPIVTESVFLRGTLTNASEYQLLPGTAQVFMGGDFIGETQVPSVAPKGEFKVFFGPDRALRARREIVSKVTGASGLFGNSTATTWKYRIALDNGTGRDVKVELLDRRPVSRNDRIEVRVSDVAPALSTDKAYADTLQPQGILRWDLSLPATARGDQAATVRWTVDVIRANDLRMTPVPE
jgi:uncharacterized protein (TIGR02231 family)